jgi:hypothetical protein
MHRRALALCLLLFAVPAFAQQKDRVHFRDRATGKEDSVDGDVTESPAGVKVAVNNKDRLIPAADVLRVEYVASDPVPGRLAANQAEQKTPAEAVKFYADAAKAVPPTAPDKVKRSIAFREAYWAGVAAAAKDGDEFKADARKAADKMAAFVKDHGRSWEQWQVGRTAARLYGELGDWAAADGVLKALTQVGDVPPELKVDAKLTRLGYLLRAGKYADAGPLQAEMAADTATPGQKDRMAIYREALAVLPAKPAEADPAQAKRVSDAISKIEKVIAASKDPAARSVGYGVLGEVQLAHRQPRQATWSFLTVDTVYPQDADERLFAVLRLVEIFTTTGDKEGDKSRADQFRDRLPKVR